MDDVALTGSLAGGDAEGLLAVFDAYGHRLHTYAAFLLGDAEAGGDAVLDALLVAAGAADGLADPGRLRPWLYALTRNECLRVRLPDGRPQPAGAAEAVELADRHRMPAADVAAVLGLPVEDAAGFLRDRHPGSSPGGPPGAGAGAAADDPLTEPPTEPPTEPLAGLLPAAGSRHVPAEVAAGGPVSGLLPAAAGGPRVPAEVAAGGPVSGLVSAAAGGPRVPPYVTADEPLTELLPAAGGPCVPPDLAVDEPLAGHRAQAGAEDAAAALSGGPVPASLRAAVAAGGGPDAARRRSELTRRARPFEPDGFPVPLDRRRLSGAVLAWSAAAVVLLALGLLVVLPVRGSDAVGAAPAGQGLAAAGPPAVAADQSQPVPTLATSPFPVEAQPDQAATSSSPPPATRDRGTEPGTATAAPRAAGGGQDVPSPSAAGPGGNRDRVSATALSVTWSPQTGSGCGGSWTADVRARPYGPGADGVTGVQATVSGAGGQWTVVLRPDGDEWRGQVAGLPTERPLTLTVRASSAGGAAIEASRRLAFSCR